MMTCATSERCFSHPDYPLYQKLPLSRQEEDWGLLDDFRTITIVKDGSDAWKNTVPHPRASGGLAEGC